jgi:ABC-type uncharacterized transport system ATPase subunit
VGHADTEQMDKRSLARMMIGREYCFSFSREKDAENREGAGCGGRNVVDGDKGYPVVNDISFQIFRNEIFGIAGVSGNGQRELVEAITGLRTVKNGQHSDQ